MPAEYPLRLRWLVRSTHVSGILSTVAAVPQILLSELSLDQGAPPRACFSFRLVARFPHSKITK
jgi:hypothetical protein